MAAATFGLALVLTQHEAGDLDGRLRTASTLLTSGIIALGVLALQDGFHLPQVASGWWGLAAPTATPNCRTGGTASTDAASL